MTKYCACTEASPQNLLLFPNFSKLLDQQKYRKMVSYVICFGQTPRKAKAAGAKMIAVLATRLEKP